MTMHLVESAPAAPRWLANLYPLSGRPALAPSCSRSLQARATTEVGGSAVAWGVELAHEAASRIVREFPAFAAGDGAFDDLRMGVESVVLQILLLLAGANVDQSLTAENRAVVAEYVRREIPVTTLVDAIHFGHTVISGALLAACETLGAPSSRLGEIQYIAGWLFEYYESFEAEMVAQYQIETDRRVSRDSTARLRVVSSVLASAHPENELKLSRLGYDLSRTHVALVLWRSTRSLDANSIELQAAASDALRAMHCVQQLVVPVSSGRVWAWGTVTSFTPETELRFHSTVLPPGARAVMGNPSSGVEGFRRSHREAEAAHALLTSIPTEADHVTYENVDLASLLMADRDRAVSFARRELGPLVSSTPQSISLRKTVAAFLELQGSAHHTAQRLYISRNTVAYRVHRAEELMGRSVTARPLQLQAALAIVDALGGLD